MAYPFDCITDLIFVATSLEPSDVILIPGGSHPQLMERAAQLYRQGLAPLILPSGGPNPLIPEYASEWAFLKEVGICCGVPESAILREERALNTLENARFSLKALQERQIRVKKAILVCKAFHARRALLTYQSVFPPEVTFFVAPVTDKRGITRDCWYLIPDHIQKVMEEVAKIGEYCPDFISTFARARYDQIVEGALGWALNHLGSQDYPALCYAFCEDAYELGAAIILDGQGTTAKEAADAYHPLLEGVPPRGSYVFYDCSGELKGDYRNWGHMGLSLGDGRVVHAWGGAVRLDDFHAIETLDPPPGWTPAVYTGWAPPQVFLKGMRVKTG